MVVEVQEFICMWKVFSSNLAFFYVCSFFARMGSLQVPTRAHFSKRATSPKMLVCVKIVFFFFGRNLPQEKQGHSE